MPDSTISNLSSLTGASLAPNDIFALVDVSDTSMGAGGTNKKITRAELCTFDMGSITTSTPLLDLAQTWNNAGGTFSAFRINITDTASTNGTLIDLQVGGVSKFNVSKAGAVAAAGGFNASTNDLYNARYVKFNGSSYLASATDGHLTLYNNAGTNLVNFVVESNHTLALRSSTNFQELRLYGSYTDGSNYDRLIFGPSGASQFRISSDQAGTGTSRHLVFGTSNTDRFYINGSSGHLLAATDASYDIGASGANRPRNIYAAGSAIVAGNFGWPAKSQILSPTDGIIGLYNFAGTDFGRLQFGGTTSSFPALKRNGTTIDVKLADDSAFCNFSAASFTATGQYIFSGVGRLAAQGDGVITLFNSAQTDFGRLQFGGTTSSFPSLKRSSTSLLVRLADDSGFGFFNAYVDSSNTTAVNSVGFRGVPQNTQNADYTFTHTDSGLQVFHDEVSARTYTIPANASVPFNIGTTITIINNTGAGNIVITSADTIRRGDGVAGTGSRTIGPDSIVNLIKTKATEWMITGAFF